MSTGCRPLVRCARPARSGISSARSVWKFLFILHTVPAAAFVEGGYSSVAMNFRGCSGDLNRRSRAYHSGVSDDLQEVLSAVIETFNPDTISLVGYSLGGNVLLKWLGEGRDYAMINRAVAVSTPFTLSLCSQAMLSGAARLYGGYFTRRLLSDFLAKRRAFKQAGAADFDLLSELGDMSHVSSILDFDDAITAPLHGFRNASDYYERCSSINLLPVFLFRPC